MQNTQNMFRLHSDYAPIGDQSQAIVDLVRNFEDGNQFQPLFGVIGSCKIFAMAMSLCDGTARL